VLTRRRLGQRSDPECALSTGATKCRQLATAVDDPPDPPEPPDPDPDDPDPDEDDPDEDDPDESDDPEEDDSDFDPDEVVDVVEVVALVSVAVEEDRLSVR